MGEWKEKTLADLCTEISYGYTESAKQEKVGPKFLRITDIANGRLDWANVPYCPISDSDFEKYKLLPGDIVIARTGATTGANYTIKEVDPKDVVFASYLIRYKIDKKQANPYFIGNILQSSNWKEYVDAIAGGSAQPGANAKQLGSFEISLPPLPEQTAIASILSSLDDKINLLQRQNTTLEKMAETLFRQWFVEEAKEEWEEVRITDLFEVRDGTHDSPKQKEFGKRLITSKHLSKHTIDFEGAYFISDDDYEQINKRSKVETGDILFSMIGTIGIIYLEQSREIDYAIKNIGLFKTSQNPIWKYFTVLWLKSDLGDEFIHENRSGSTQEYISLGSLRSIKFSIPSIETVELFNKEVEALFQKIKSNQTQIRTLTALRDTLLPKLMSGEVRVKM